MHCSCGGGHDCWIIPVGDRERAEIDVVVCCCGSMDDYWSYYAVSVLR